MAERGMLVKDKTKVVVIVGDRAIWWDNVRETLFREASLADVRTIVVDLKKGWHTIVFATILLRSESLTFNPLSDKSSVSYCVSSSKIYIGKNLNNFLKWCLRSPPPPTHDFSAILITWQFCSVSFFAIKPPLTVFLPVSWVHWHTFQFSSVFTRHELVFLLHWNMRCQLRVFHQNSSEIMTGVTKSCNSGDQFSYH